MIEIYADSKELVVQKLKEYILKQITIIEIEEVKDPMRGYGHWRFASDKLSDIYVA